MAVLMKIAVVGGYGVALTMRLDRFPAEGETVLARCRSESVDAGAVATGTGATMLGSVLVDSSGENRIIIAAGVLGEFTEGLIDGFRAEIAAADVLLV